MPYAFHLGILCKLWVHVEKHRHINLFTRPQPLLLKAEALDLVEILARLLWRHVIGGHACHGLVAGIVRRVEGKCTLTWRNLLKRSVLLAGERECMQH